MQSNLGIHTSPSSNKPVFDKKIQHGNDSVFEQNFSFLTAAMHGCWDQMQIFWSQLLCWTHLGVVLCFSFLILFY